MSERPRARQDLTVVELDGEAVVYDETSGSLHHLNSAATLIFMSLDGSVTLESLAEEIASSTGLPSVELERQVGEVVGTFAEAGLLEVAGA